MNSLYSFFAPKNAKSQEAETAKYTWHGYYWGSKLLINDKQVGVDNNIDPWYPLKDARFEKKANCMKEHRNHTNVMVLPMTVRNRHAVHVPVSINLILFHVDLSANLLTILEEIFQRSKMIISHLTKLTTKLRIKEIQFSVKTRKYSSFNRIWHKLWYRKESFVIN